MASVSLTQEKIFKKFHNSDISLVHHIKRRSDQILWVLKKIKKDFKIDEYVTDSILSDIFVEILGITCSAKSVNNSLKPATKKIHKKIVEGEFHYKIMHVGIQYIEKLAKKKYILIPHMSDSTFSDLQSIENTVDVVKKLDRNKKLKSGLYYIVLIDLVGSSEASAKISPEDNKKRINEFIKLTKNSLSPNPKNFCVFVKSIGDASLFLFTNFEDILDWATSVDSSCDDYNQKCISQKPDIFHMYTKKCVHLGEVIFDDDSDPIALVVNQIAKIEKKLKQDQFGITDSVRLVIFPKIESRQLSKKIICEIKLPGEDTLRPLWAIGYDS